MTPMGDPLDHGRTVVHVTIVRPDGAGKRVYFSPDTLSDLLKPSAWEDAFEPAMQFLLDPTNEWKPPVPR
jgi:hypothetical protein